MDGLLEDIKESRQNNINPNGVTECMNDKNELFSDSALYDTLNNMLVETMSLKSILKKIREKLDEFAEGAPRSDDITRLIFRNKSIEYKDPKDKDQNI